jgi:hypothetical protein
VGFPVGDEVTPAVVVVVAELEPPAVVVVVAELEPPPVVVVVVVLCVVVPSSKH